MPAAGFYRARRARTAPRETEDFLQALILPLIMLAGAMQAFAAVMGAFVCFAHRIMRAG